MLDIILMIKRKSYAAVIIAKRNINLIVKILLILSFAVPFSILYYLEPVLFERTWIGRTFYLFFLWLVILEIILNWENLRGSRLKKVVSLRTVLFIMMLLIPTLYVAWANYFGLNDMIRNLAQQNNLTWEAALLMRIPAEYLVFTLLFALTVLLVYGVSGLRHFSTSIFFLGIIGTLYAINMIYGNEFAPFKILIPATTQFSANALNLIGYRTVISIQTDPQYGTLPVLAAFRMNGDTPVAFQAYGIGWPCSGIESLLIYTVVVSLFLRTSPIRWRFKIAYFAIGAFITYFVNILRIVSIFVIMLNGGNQQTFQDFHDYYGPLYSVLWITFYPLIIMGIQALSVRFGNTRTEAKKLNSTISQQ